MAETFLVSGDTTEETDLNRFFALSDPVAKPSALEEEASAIKELQPQATIDQTPTRATEPHLDSDRVTSPPEEVAKKVAQAVTSALFEEADETISEGLLYRICNIVNELMALYSEVSENKQIQVVHLKQDFEKSRHNASGLIRTSGAIGAWFAGGSVVLLGVGMVIPQQYEGIKKICEFSAQQLPTLGNAVKSSYDGDQHSEASKESLDLSELQAKANQTGQQDTSRITELLSAAQRAQESASRAGG